MDTPIDLLQLSFAYAGILRVIRADNVVAPSEIAWLHGRFPTELLHQSGFVDPSGAFTEAYTTTLEEARRTLPERLTLGQKLALMDLLVQAAASDEILADEEAELLPRIARELGVDDQAWVNHLDELVASGKVKRS